MKTYEQLTEAQKEEAITLATNILLENIVTGEIEFNDNLNHDDLQARIDAAWAKANQMQTPWFAGEYIMDTCRDDIESMAQAYAEDAVYPELGEQVIRLRA